MANVFLALDNAQERIARRKKLLEEAAPESGDPYNELRKMALTCALDIKVSVDARFFSQVEEIVRREIDVPEAHLILMRCYLDGGLVQKNRTTSSFHLNEAARKGNDVARYLKASNDAGQSDPEKGYEAIAELIELALHGNYWIIREDALWTAVRLLRETLQSSKLITEDAEFLRFYEATFKNENPDSMALKKDAIARMSAAIAQNRRTENEEASATHAEAKKSEAEEWRQRSRMFLARHHERIKGLGNPQKKEICRFPADPEKLSLPLPKQPTAVLKVSSPIPQLAQECQNYA